MPITGLEWVRDLGLRRDSSRDRHVLRTVLSPSLLEPFSIFLFPESGQKLLAEEYLAGDVTLECRPLFRAERGLKLTPDGLRPTFSGFGIHVDMATGAVSCDAGLPPPDAPSNFLIQVSVVTNAGGRVAATDITPLLVRIHLHDAVTQLRLTPDELTIHREGADVREKRRFGFTALAAFTDGTTGDVTLNHNLTWTAESPLEIQANGFVILPPRNVTGQTFRVTAMTQAQWGSKASNTAVIRVAPPWDSVPAAPRALLVDGPSQAWTIGHTADTSANVLFLGSGFPIADTDAYAAMLKQICHFMKRDQTTRPYDLLADSMIFWSLQVPSQTRGISVQCQVRLSVDDKGRTVAKPFPATRRPPGPGTTPWTPLHLLYAVGLPIAADATAPSVLRGQFANRALAEFAVAIRDTRLLPDTAIEEWRRWADRTFIDQVDAFPPLALGVPPSVEIDSNVPLVGLHQDRGGEGDLQQFLRTIIADNGTTVGANEHLGVIWAENRPGFSFQNPSLLTVIGASNAGRSNHPWRGHTNLVLEPADRPIPVRRLPGQSSVGLDVQQKDLGFDHERELWRVYAHELSHVILFDEYVDKPGSLPADPLFVAVVDLTPNVQSLASIMASGKISGDLIKWRWPRIRKAAVIDGIISVAGSGFTVPVMRGHGLQFKRDDKVRLRSRTRKVPLKRFDRRVDVSTEEFTVVSDPSQPGDAVSIARMNRGEAIAETVTTLGRFVPGSLLFQPVEPPSTIPRHEYPYAELLTDSIRRGITATGEPLTDWPCDAEFELAQGGEVQIPRFDQFLSVLFSRRNNPRAVGLYSGGAGYGCGVFHPTGLCMMRNQADFEGVDEFCVVCRYALVDMFDPTRHAAIEAVLARRNFE